MKTIKLNTNKILLFILSFSFLTACQPDETGAGNGLSDPNVDAAFNILPVDGAPNRFILKGSTTNVVANKWDIGNGLFNGSDTEEIFLPDAGAYTITHTAVGRGGIRNTVSQEFIVATSDPVSGNLVVDGKFTNGQGVWQVLNIGSPGTAWTFAQGDATISGSGWNQQGIFQAIQVEANKQYQIDMKVTGGGAVNTWFEVYLSPEAPVQGNDYSADGRRMGLSTWDGCGNTDFNGLLSDIMCVGSGNVVEFNQSGTVYLVIKGGGESLGPNGIKITNVELRGI
jgi:hypothetical protein